RVPRCVSSTFPLQPPRSALVPYTTLFRSSPSGTPTPPTATDSSPSTAITLTRTRRTRTCLTPRPSRPAGSGRQARACPARPCERSEEHTSELQSREKLVCRLLLEKKKKKL